MIGRFELRQMIGRSHASSTWLVNDPRLGQELLLCVPRALPGTNAERDAWTQDVLTGTRLKHPRIAEVLEVGVHEGWPFVACERAGGTLQERIQSGSPLTPQEVAQLTVDLLDGLAYAHEAGVAHRDLGLHSITLDQQGRAQLVGLAVGLEQLPPHQTARPTRNRQETREAAERDLLMVGLLMYRLLVNHPPLDEADLGHAAKRVGPEIVRLPWTTPHPVPDTLRAIVNRATDRQQRQRYLNARTLLSALQGWIKTNSQEAGGPLLLLLDRLNSVGALPGRERTERALLGALSQETLRVDDFVDVVVKNPALVWEMLRSVNTARFQSRSADDGTTTLSRAIMLLGQEGLRKVISSVRPWPGVLGAQQSRANDGGAAALQALENELWLCCLAGHIARLMAPFSIHDEEAAVAAMSQRLGWLLVLYHFPEEAAQVQRLMQPGPPASAGGAPTPGMSLDAAAGAVLGINLDDLSAAVLKHWGLHERLIKGARPLPLNTPVRHPGTPEDTVRVVASLGNELASCARLPTEKQSAAIHQAYLRYVRPLQLTPKECVITMDHAMRLLEGRQTDPEVVAQRAAARAEAAAKAAAQAAELAGDTSAGPVSA